MTDVDDLTEWLHKRKASRGAAALIAAVVLVAGFIIAGQFLGQANLIP